MFFAEKCFTKTMAESIRVGGNCGLTSSFLSIFLISIKFHKLINSRLPEMLKRRCLPWLLCCTTVIMYNWKTNLSLTISVFTYLIYLLDVNRRTEGYATLIHDGGRHYGGRKEGRVPGGTNGGTQGVVMPSLLGGRNFHLSAKNSTKTPKNSTRQPKIPLKHRTTKVAWMRQDWYLANNLAIPSFKHSHKWKACWWKVKICTPIVCYRNNNTPSTTCVRHF